MAGATCYTWGVPVEGTTSQPPWLDYPSGGMVDVARPEGYDGPPIRRCGAASEISVRIIRSLGADLTDNAVADLFASKFIARRDVKAIQRPGGIYGVHTRDGKADGERIPWTRADLNAHISGQQTFGHYLLNPDDQVKLFSFDIDLEKNKPEANPPFMPGCWVQLNPDEGTSQIFPIDAREAWRDRRHPGRGWLKYQLKLAAHELMYVIHSELELPTACTYTGNKGLHVYAFTGLISAADAREGAQLVMDTLGKWAPSRGTNFYRSINQDPIEGSPNLTIEVFPKQDSLGGADGLGNLMRLPLGKNLKSPKDPTFFMDMRTPLGEFTPLDPLAALSGRSPWSDHL